MGPLQVETTRTGQTVVRVSSPRSYADVAEAVYGDASLGPALAELAGASPEDRLSRGDVLVVPPRGELEAKLRVVRSADVHYRDGLAAADRGAYRQAADHFRAAAEAAPHRTDYRYNLGLALLGAGEAAAATPVLEQVAHERPDHADSRYAFGNALRQRRAWDRAIGEYEAALRLKSGFAGASYALARTWEDKGNSSRARQAYRTFLARFGDDPLAAKARERLAVLDTQRDPSATPTP
jgi:tetratricopeptide (TPR) repeat protein